MAEVAAYLPPVKAKTGSGGRPWLVYDSPKPPRVADRYAYWGEAPPEPSARARWWLRQIERGWRPSERVRREGYDSSAEWYGVYIWEYINLISPAVDGER